MRCGGRGASIHRLSYLLTYSVVKCQSRLSYLPTYPLTWQVNVLIFASAQLMMSQGLEISQRSKGQDVERCTKDQEQGTNKDKFLALLD
jgi:hypothetical protein